ncbi:hypothetical protein V8C37DRAFT_377010, partial [Trichoderma ceciliae]
MVLKLGAWVGPYQHQVVSDAFQNTLNWGLVSVSTSYDGLDQFYAFLGNVRRMTSLFAFGRRNGPVHELSTPYILY